MKTAKYWLQFTTTDKIKMLKKILGSTITVSTRNGFPTAPKQLLAGDDYLFSKQTAGDSEYVNTVLPDDDKSNSNSVNRYYFLWTRETEKLRVTTQWERLQITNLLVREELRRAAQGDCSDASSDKDESTEIQIGDDFPYDQAQFEIQNFIGETHVWCVVIESNGVWLVGRYKKFRCKFVKERMKENY
jgi:hypothetical protein